MASGAREVRSLNQRKYAASLMLFLALAKITWPVLVICTGMPAAVAAAALPVALIAGFGIKPPGQWITAKHFDFVIGQDAKPFNGIDALHHSDLIHDVGSHSHAHKHSAESSKVSSHYSEYFYFIFSIQVSHRNLCSKIVSMIFLFHLKSGHFFRYKT